MYLSCPPLYQEVWSAQLLLDDQSTETSMPKSVFPLVSVSKGCTSIFSKFRMTFTLTQYLRKSPSHNRDFPFFARNELIKSVFPWRSSIGEKSILAFSPLMFRVSLVFVSRGMLQPVVTSSCACVLSISSCLTQGQCSQREKSRALAGLSPSFTF